MTKSIETTTPAQLSSAKRTLLERLARGEHTRREPATRRIPLRDSSEPLLPTYFQESLWYSEQFNPGADLGLNLFGCMHLRGVIDLSLFEHALSALTARHAMLRTSFLADEPLMVIADALRAPFELVDLTSLPEAQRVPEALRLSRALGIRRIPITRGPLWSCKLYRIHPEEHVLTIITHHMIADGWSFGVLLSELCALYDASVTGRDAALPKLEIDYPDYASWQRARADWGPNVDYWVKSLSGTLPTLRLPNTKRPGEPQQVDTLTFCVSEALSENVRAFARRTENSLFVTLLATYQLFLHRLSGQRDLLVGSPFSGRETETEPLVGVFIAVSVLRTLLEPQQRTFLQFLEHSRQTTLAAIDHQDLPMEKLLEALPKKPQFYTVSFHQVLFDMFNFPMPKEGQALKVRPLYMDGGMAPFDLSLFVDDSAKQEMVVTLAYCTDLYARETVEGWARGWLALLSAATDRPETLIDALPLASDTPLQLHISDASRPSQRAHA